MPAVTEDQCSWRYGRQKQEARQASSPALGETGIDGWEHLQCRHSAGRSSPRELGSVNSMLSAAALPWWRLVHYWQWMMGMCKCDHGTRDIWTCMHVHEGAIDAKDHIRPTGSEFDPST